MEIMERIGEERALINALSKKRERKWIGRTLQGRRLTTKIGYRKNMEGKRTRADEKYDAVLDADICMESFKKKPISEKSGHFGHLILSRKRRAKEEPTKRKP